MENEVLSVEQDTRNLAKYDTNLQDLAKACNPMLTPKMLQDFLLMYDEASFYLGKAVYLQSQLKSEVDLAESIAYLERASDYLKSKNIKDTSEARKMYIPLDADVQRVSTLQSRIEAVVTLLKNKIVVFKCAHDDSKKLAYGQENQ